MPNLQKVERMRGRSYRMCCRSEKPELDTNDGEIGDALERVDVLIMCDDRQAPAGSDRRDPHIIDPGSDGWTPDERVGIDRSLQAYTVPLDPAGLRDERAEVTLVGGRVMHPAGVVADPVGDAVGEDRAASSHAVCAHAH
jgi:hypothetical protein